MIEMYAPRAIEAATEITVRCDRRHTAYWRLIEVDDTLMIAIAPKDGDAPTVVTVPTDAPVSELLERIRARGGAVSAALFGYTGDKD